MSTRPLRRLASILLVLLTFTVGCSGTSNSTPLPTPTPSNIQPDDIWDVIFNCSSGRCTTAQEEQLLNQFVGTRVRWTERVTDVDGNGTVRIITSGLFLDLYGIPRSQTNALRVRDEITFEGTLAISPDRLNELFWEVRNAVIIP